MCECVEGAAARRVSAGTLGVGTLRYMAPELLLGHYSGRGPEADPVTNRVDIYRYGHSLADSRGQNSGLLPLALRVWYWRSVNR
jgi:serine/threonine protein kinase